MDSLRELKPLRAPFLIWRVFWSTIIVLVLGLLVTALFPVSDMLVWSIAAAIILLVAASRGARYRKERYVFYKDRMVVHSGGLVSDNKTELVYGRVTHVTHTLPWISHMIFGTGIVQVQSAGSSGSEATLAHIEDSAEVYEYVEGMLKSAGFSLARNQLLISTKPHPLAVFLATSRSFLGVLVVLFWLALDIGLSAVSDALAAVSVFLVPILLIALVAVAVFGVLRFLHLSRRTYSVFDDTIVYEEGFLTKRYAFLPAENLSDSSTTQTFIDRLLGLYDVKVSVQGTGSEVSFSNLKQGREMDKAIDRIIDEHSTPIGTTTAKTASEKSTEAPSSGPSETYRPQPGRSLIALALAAPLLLVLPLYLIIAAGYLIRTYSQSYEIRSGRVIYNKRFLGTKRIEFTADKVTQIEFTVGILDRFFNTMSVSIKSIGSGENVTLFALPDTPEVRKAVLSVDGLSESGAVRVHDGRFSFWGSFIRYAQVYLIFALFSVLALLVSWLAGPAWIGLIVVALSVSILLVITVYERLHYADSALSVHQDYVRYHSGWLRKTVHYARFDAVKDLTSKQYWRSSSGDATINIAGEETIQSGKNQASRSQSFTAAYLADVFDVHDALLVTVGGKKSPKRVEQAVPQARNTVVWFVIVFPLIVFIPLLIWSYSRREYLVLSDRIVYERGIFSRRRTSLLYEMMDHVRSGQGLLNKVFSNGRVRVYTTGSSTVELSLGPLSRYEELARAIEKQYS